MPDQNFRPLCHRCGGRLVASEEDIFCLMCGYVEYPADYEPLGPIPVDPPNLGVDAEGGYLDRAA